MKKTLGCVFTVIGSVVGAGFLSGRELVRFFGTDGVVFVLPFAWGCFAFFLYFSLSLGQRYGGYIGVLAAFPPLWATLFRGCLLVSCFISLSGMFAGLTALSSFPILSALCGVAAFFLCRRGVNAFYKINLAFVPCVFVFFTFAIFRSGVAFDGSVFSFRAISCLSYVGMNVFLAFPVLCDLGKEGGGNISFCALTAASILVFFTALILGGVRAVGGETLAFPLSRVFQGSAVYPVIAFFGTLTSLLSSYYPLSRLTKKRKNADVAGGMILATAFALSFFGFKNIVEYGYPVMGGMGATFLIVAVLYDALFKEGDDRVHPCRHKAK